MLHEPFYNPNISYEENFQNGPFGAFADNGVNENIGEPKYDFFGHKVYSPFGIPAGPLINGKFCKAALDKGFDIVTYKTVRTKAYPCHPWPNVLSVDIKDDLTMSKAQGALVADNVFNEPLSITNSFGVPSLDPKFWQKDIASVIKEARTGQIVVGAFQGTKTESGDVGEYINDFCIAARMLKSSGAKVLEVNLSCPNEGTANLLCYDIQRSKEVVKAIKKEIGETPLIIKIAYYENFTELRKFVREVGSVVDGISAINTIAAEILDKAGKHALPGVGRARSGVCGHAIKWAGLDMVEKLKEIRQETSYNYKIIGVGGVMNAGDFKEYKDKGADFVMSATGAMWNPNLAEEIKSRL
jgi:dihydroorotate dehydrogenase (NAD+) catalytic subunit